MLRVFVCAAVLTAASPLAAQHLPPQQTTDPRDKMDVSGALGGGITQLLHLQIDALISRRWSVGAHVGGFPVDPMLNAIMGTDTLDKMAAQYDIDLHGMPDTKLVSAGVNAHWYPFAKMFFVEAAFEMWWLSNETSAGILGVEELDFIEVTTKVSVFMPMIGLRGGWRFLHKKGFFVEISGGLNILFSTDTKLELGGTTIEAVQEYEEGAEYVELAQDLMGRALKKGVNKVAHTLPVYPSATLRMGWAFDIVR